MLIEIVILVFVMFMYLKLIFDLKKNKISLRRFFFGIFIWFSLSVVVFFPQIVFFFAGVLGIERARDLPIYVSIIILFILIFKIGINMEKMEQGITKIVKKIALDHEE